MFSESWRLEARAYVRGVACDPNWVSLQPPNLTPLAPHQKVKLTLAAPGCEGAHRLAVEMYLYVKDVAQPAHQLVVVYR